MPFPLPSRLAARPPVPATAGDDGLLPGPAALLERLARGVRADDWLGRAGAGEFAVLVCGRADAAEVAVARLVRTVGGVVTGLAAAAGISEVERGLPAAEVRRRALRCLEAARARGAGELVRYRGSC